MMKQKKKTSFSFHTVRRVLLDQPGVVDEDYRAHVGWCVREGLLSEGGLTRKGMDQRDLVRSEKVFKEALHRCVSTFGSRSWPQLIWILRKQAPDVVTPIPEATK